MRSWRVVAGVVAGLAGGCDWPPAPPTVPPPAPASRGDPSAVVSATVDALRDPAPHARVRAARSLAMLAQSGGQDVPLDAVLGALKERIAPGRDRESDERVAEAIFEASQVVGYERGRRHGVRVARPAAAIFEDDGALTWHVIERLWDATSIYDGREVLDRGLALATPGQRALYAIWWTKSEVENGGFDQYFRNPTGILARDAAAGLRLVDASDAAAVVERAIAAFPGGEAPDDASARQRLLRAMPADALAGLDDAFYAANHDERLFRLTAAYVRAHPGEFFTD